MQLQASGTLTVAVGAEYTLARIAGPLAGVFILLVDLSAMQAGDTVEFRSKSSFASGPRAIAMDSFSDLQSADAMIYQSPHPLLFRIAGSFTLKQTAGTGRSYDWRIEQIDL